MCNTLLLHICGPLQSWGVQSRAKDRDTGLEPSKSGVIGLLCAALGVSRTDKMLDARVTQLAQLVMGVRIDRAGVLLRDYHTAGKDGYRRANGSLETKTVIVTSRYYLADAAFLVGLAGDDLDLLKTLHAALCNPVWPLYLGRKAFVPGEPLWLEDGLKEGVGLRQALSLEVSPWQPRPGQKHPDRLRLVIETEDGSEVRSDQPLSFAERRFAPRRVTTTFIDLSGLANLTDLNPLGGEP
jgi:CRISPR system Cascade subunit CasD